MFLPWDWLSTITIWYHTRFLSHVQCVSNKGGMTLVKNEEGELMATRLVTRWWVCIHYTKVNNVTKKDHYPLPFIDQCSKRLAGHVRYCFLDGSLGYYQVSITHKDYDKTTLTCSFRTFINKNMIFRFCNESVNFQRCIAAIFSYLVQSTIDVFMNDFSVFDLDFTKMLGESRYGTTKVCEE